MTGHHQLIANVGGLKKPKKTIEGNGEGPAMEAPSLLLAVQPLQNVHVLSPENRRRLV